ncbi:MAG: hypothetical protein AAGD34_00145 [Pseudomonadota bacterium]
MKRPPATLIWIKAPAGLTALRDGPPMTKFAAATLGAVASTAAIPS